MLGAHRVRRFVEDEVFVLEARIDLEAHLARLVEYPPEHAARTRRLGLFGEFGKEDQHSGFKGDVTASVGQDTHLRIRITGMPSGFTSSGFMDGSVEVEVGVGY
jgi:hypothetical protein